MRILIADRHPETALAAFASDGAPYGNHHVGAPAGGRLLHGVNGVPEAVPAPRLDAAVRS